MANFKKGEVEILNHNDNGKAYVIRFTTNALCDLETALNMGINEFFQLIRTRELSGQSLTLKEIRTVLWAGLHESYEDLTPRDVGNIIDGAGMLVAMDAIRKALTAAFPTAEKEVKKNLTAA